MGDKSSLLGLAAILGWCLFSAMARVITSHVTQHVNPIILCFYTFLISSAVFLFLKGKNISTTFTKLAIGKNKNNLLWLNITTFGAWFFLIYPLKYIEPAIVSTITLGLSPIATIILGSLIYKNKTANPSDIFIAVILFFVILYTVFLCFSGEAMLEKLNVANLLLVIGSCFIVGFATAAGNLYAKKLSDDQFTPTEILSSRFLLTVLLSGIIIGLRGDNIFIPAHYFVDIVVTALCLVIIPLYLAQVSIKQLEPITVAIVAPLMPVLVIFFELADHRIHLSFDSILVTVVTSLLVLFGVYVQYKKMRRISYNSSKII